ncbi:MAG: glutamate synthase [Actinobacteria bacterium BACL2 MAG-121220-bin52]|jgi:glutamate synthase (NADPH) small chain|uniref:Glutamate synthase n=2 Tax=ac1 cluster TaxID=1655545 RepID=A0A0R2P666_9ACTN|nr:MAG: glutamate synthase [Actinobacteria bacterium BACL2 MAG-120802-bin41]KRO33560.1 MAG: glutamate synthase [Actinobacteria bacterium BACL2 MAG-121220-bin52]
MADPRGFLNTGREVPKRRPVDVRIRDWREVYEEQEFSSLQKQAGRCMDCGIPFCHQGCPLGNLIPEWNDLIWRNERSDALDRLHATNNFPEFTGRLCPAPCETSCVLGINQDPVTIKQVELRIIEEGFQTGNVKPLQPDRMTGKTIAVIGSGPAGLAAAQQLTRAGHTVVVYEKGEKVGGLLRYGIPEFKMEKSVLDRRINQMQREGTRFRAGVNVGVDISAADLRAKYDAIVLAVGATQWRELDIPGRTLNGVYQAMEYLPWGNKQALNELPSEPPINAKGKNVIILGGGDTGADCLGTAIRQGAASVTQIEIMPRPSDERPDSQPWPTYPMTYRVSSAHEESGERLYSISTEEFIGDSDGQLTALKIVETKYVDGKFEKIPGTSKNLPADMVLLAMGFTGPEKNELVNALELKLDPRGNIARDNSYRTNVDSVYICGDAGRGQSLIVWAIAEGRSAASAVDADLMGHTQLPSPIEPTARPLTV